MSVPLVLALVISIAVVMAAVSVIRRLEAETGVEPGRRPQGAAWNDGGSPGRS